MEGCGGKKTAAFVPSTGSGLRRAREYRRRETEYRRNPLSRKHERLKARKKRGVFNMIPTFQYSGFPLYVGVSNFRHFRHFSAL
jgi:hypothetical protein